MTDLPPDNFATTEPRAEEKPRRPRWPRIAVPALILLVVVGLYFLKNPIGGDAPSGTQSAAFDLDATADFDLEAILSHNQPVIVDFGSETCVPCQELAPILEELNRELRGKAVIKYVDVYENTDVSNEFPIEVIPTQFFFNADGSPYVPADLEEAAANGFILYTLTSSGEHALTAHQGGLGKEELLAVLKEMGMP